LYVPVNQPMWSCLLHHVHSLHALVSALGLLQLSSPATRKSSQNNFQLLYFVMHHFVVFWTLPILLTAPDTVPTQYKERHNKRVFMKISERFLHSLWNLEIQSCNHKNLSLDHIQSHINPFSFLTSYLFKIHFNTVLQSTPSLPKWSVPFQFSDQTLLCISHFLHAQYRVFIMCHCTIPAV